jgi:hypothetical protein
VRLVPRRPAPDPLAVWTCVEAGEEIACGDPSVTDQQRAAAGRETVAVRSRALLQENRRRAAEQHAAGGAEKLGPRDRGRRAHLEPVPTSRSR